MKLDKQAIICGGRRYGHAASILSAGLGVVLATSWAVLHPCAQALACWLVVETVFYLQQLWRSVLPCLMPPSLLLDSYGFRQLLTRLEFVVDCTLLRRHGSQ